MFKKTIFVLIIFSISILTGAEEKIRVAILPFSSKNIDKDLLEVMFQSFTTTMVDAKVYSIVERSQLDKAIYELKFQRGDIFDDSSASALGKMAGAQIVILGDVSFVSRTDTYYVNIRGINVTTGIVDFAKKDETKLEKDLVKVVDNMAKFISFGKDVKLDNNENKKKLERKKQELARQKEHLEKYRKAEQEKARLEKERLEREKQELAKQKEQLEKERQEKDRKAEQEKARLERERLAKETEKNRVNNISSGKFNKSEENFINKYYGAWGFSLDDRNNSFLKYKQSIGGGAALISIGGITFLTGLISMVVMFNYNKIIIENEWVWSVKYAVKKQVYPAYGTAPIVGGILMPVGGLLCIFSAIPFWFSYMIATIYNKETGRKLAFFERASFNAEFTMQTTQSRICNELRFCITILL